MIVDLLAGEDIGRSPIERELLGRERELAETIRLLQRRILQISGEVRTGELLERLRSAEGTYRELIGRLGAEDKKLLSLVSVQGIDAPSIQRLLDGNTTLFDYFVTEKSLYVWAIHRDMVHLEQIALTREALRNLVFSFLGAIHDKKKRRTESISRKAYDLLLKPVIPFVSGERIGFIPDDSLVYLPFAAMSYRGKFLAEGFSLFQLSGLGFARTSHVGEGAVGFADTRLRRPRPGKRGAGSPPRSGGTGAHPQADRPARLFCSMSRRRRRRRRR